MCDETTERENEAVGLSRRAFTAMSGAALAALVLTDAQAAALTETDVVVPTSDGEADAYFVHPSTGPAPGVLIWPDILGLRPVFRGMARRLAEAGFAVLVVNPFYRSAKAPVVEEGASFADKSVRERVLPFARALSAKTVAVDAPALLGFLDASDAVDSKKGIGTLGYCMGGSLVFHTAAVSERVGAAASFHGGGLVTEESDSPHKAVARSKARYLVAIASNDHERQPEARPALEKAFAEAGLKAEVEVYAGMHGWCVPGSKAYDASEAERAWKRLLSLLGEL